MYTLSVLKYVLKKNGTTHHFGLNRTSVLYKRDKPLYIILYKTFVQIHCKRMNTYLQ